MKSTLPFLVRLYRITGHGEQIVRPNKKYCDSGRIQEISKVGQSFETSYILVVMLYISNHKKAKSRLDTLRLAVKRENLGGNCSRPGELS